MSDDEFLSHIAQLSDKYPTPITDGVIYICGLSRDNTCHAPNSTNVVLLYALCGAPTALQMQHDIKRLQVRYFYTN